MRHALCEREWKSVLGEKENAGAGDIFVVSPIEGLYNMKKIGRPSLGKRQQAALD